jgi:hypothetical protein
MLGVQLAWNIRFSWNSDLKFHFLKWCIKEDDIFLPWVELWVCLFSFLLCKYFIVDLLLLQDIIQYPVIALATYIASFLEHHQFPSQCWSCPGPFDVLDFLFGSFISSTSPLLKNYRHKLGRIKREVTETGPFLNLSELLCSVFGMLKGL